MVSEVPSVHRPRILLIDDDRTLLRVVSMFLDVEGYDVVTATDGEEGLGALALTRPDLVILDVMMPGIDGLAVCRRIKSEPRWRNIPVVVFTALDRDQDAAACLAAGADRFVNKPFSLVGLGAVVRSQLAEAMRPAV